MSPLKDNIRVFIGETAGTFLPVLAIFGLTEDANTDHPGHPGIPLFIGMFDLNT
jgi:hypothetical protein